MKLAAIQMVSGFEVNHNISVMQRLVRQAATEGADLVLLPEFWPLLGKKDTDKLAIAETYGEGFLQATMSALAKELNIYLVGGTIPLVSPKPNKIYNSMLTFNPQGECIQRYDKIHLFHFDNEQNHFAESDTILAGTKTKKIILPNLNIAQGICYDLRFPEFFRKQLDFSLILLSAAFIYDTGKAHWLTLLKARAIENQCYLLASAQGGHHENGRKTFGHSVFIDPWGEVLTFLEKGEGIILGNFDVDVLTQIRRQLPALSNRVL